VGPSGCLPATGHSPRPTRRGGAGAGPEGSVEGAGWEGSAVRLTHAFRRGSGLRRPAVGRWRGRAPASADEGPQPVSWAAITSKLALVHGRAGGHRRPAIGRWRGRQGPSAVLRCHGWPAHGGHRAGCGWALGWRQGGVRVIVAGVSPHAPPQGGLVTGHRLSICGDGGFRGWEGSPAARSRVLTGLWNMGRKGDLNAVRDRGHPNRTIISYEQGGKDWLGGLAPKIRSCPTGRWRGCEVREEIITRGDNAGS